VALELIEETTTARGELLARKGDDRERAYLEALIARGVDVAMVPSVANGEVEQADAVAHTVDAMRMGAAVIYQAALEDGHWRGFAD